MIPQHNANVEDIKKARMLFKSIRETNPMLPQGKALYSYFFNIKS